MRFRFCLLSGALIAISLTACHRAPESSDQVAQAAVSGPPVQGDWLIQAVGADPESMNPIIGMDEIGATILGQVCEGLMQIDNYTLKIVPCLATSCDISPDQLTYTFHLRHDVTWQDGVPFTAADVKFTYDFIQNPKVDDAPVRSYFTTIKSCEVLDPYTVRFVATERYFKTLEVLGTQPLIPQHLFAGVTDLNNAPYNRAPVGTGPYKFVRWDSGSQVVLERNDHYWGPKHYLKRLVYRVIQQPYVTAQLLKKGDIDVMDPVQPLQWKREIEGSRSMQRLTRVVYDYPAYSYLGFNLRKAPFTDINVRHAVDLLIPRDKILDQLYLDEYAKPTEGYDPPTSPNYNHDIPITPYDPAQAMALLQQSGWKLDPSDGLLHKNGEALSFTVIYPSASANGEKMLELIQESLAQQGIEMKLQRMEAVQMQEQVYDWNFQCTIGGWALDINGDPSQLWSSEQAKLKKSSNFIGYQNPEADKLIAAGRLEYDDAKRAVIYRQLQKIIHDDYPVCFLFNPREIMLRSNRFQNVNIFTPRPCFDVTTWWVPTAQQKYH